METYTVFGALMLPNELGLLKVMVGISFFGWMILMLTQVVWLDEWPLAKQNVPEKSVESESPTEFLKAA